VAQAQPTRWQELPTLSQVVVEQAQTAKAVSAKREAASVEMEMVVDRVHRVAETQPQIQVQEVVAAAVIMDRCMAAQAALGLS
jgi:TATA-box binding protein (TBP) (component of TFIID and TFIIIB)